MCKKRGFMRLLLQFALFFALAQATYGETPVEKLTNDQIIAELLQHLNERDAKLLLREQDLNTRERRLEERTADYEQREQSLSEREQALQTREASMSEIETSLQNSQRESRRLRLAVVVEAAAIVGITVWAVMR